MITIWEHTMCTPHERNGKGTFGVHFNPEFKTLKFTE